MVALLLPVLGCSAGCSEAPEPSSGGTGGSGGTAVPNDAGLADVPGDSDAEPSTPPAPPPNLVVYETGDVSDMDVDPTGPALVLMGGGTDVRAAFEWWKPFLQGGDVVVLRTSGGDGYNDYLYETVGGCDSVTTLMVTSRSLADDPYVAYAVAHAEGVFLAGGDQADYLEAWKDTRLEDALHAAWSRGAVLGGTSAGCAVLGEFVFAAYEGSVYSNEALQDPYNPYMTMERGFLSLSLNAGIVTDSHLRGRDRMGRLVAFVARLEKDGWGDPVTGLGIDEDTALVVGPDGFGSVMGEGHVYVVESNGLPAVCAPGKPLTYEGLRYRRLGAGDTVHLGSLSSSVPSLRLDVVEGSLDPANPY